MLSLIGTIILCTIASILMLLGICIIVRYWGYLAQPSPNRAQCATAIVLGAVMALAGIIIIA